MSNRPSRFSNDQDYALLHSTGTSQPLPAVATESESDSDDPTNMSVRSAEANCLLDETAMDVKHLMSLCEEELDQALRQVQEEGSELARQPASTPHRVDAHTHFSPVSDTQPTLRDLEFLDHEADRFVRQQVGARYGFEGGLDRPIPWDYDRISDYHLAILRHDLIATRQAAYAYNTQSAHFQHWKT